MIRRIISKIPIFITARGNNNDILHTNMESLKFSYLFIKELNIFDQTFIISDNVELLEYAKKLGFTKFIHYPCGTDKDIKYLEYLATYRYAVENNYKPDWIILLNIDQLFKSKFLIADCINNIDDNYDIVASYTEISNRSNFFIDSNNKLINNNKDHLLTSEHDRVKMIDAAIYAIKTTFAFSCMEYDDPAEHFWSGKIRYFKNRSLYTNIYNIDDIYKIYNIDKIIRDVKNLTANNSSQ